MPLVPRAGLPRRAIALCAVAVLTAPRVVQAAWPPSPLVNVPLCATAYSSRLGNAVSDGAGGAIAVWYEDRLGDFDVFARRVSSDGTPMWTADGVPVCSTVPPSVQLLPQAVSDGAKGAVVGWIDGRGGANALYLQRVDSTGTRLWGAGGVLAATTSSQLTEFVIAADGAGGAVVAWASPAAPAISSDIYAQRVNATGVLQWGTAGRTLCSNKFEQVHPVIARKASGTFVVAWEDQRQLFRSDIYAQALNGTGTALWAANGLLLAGSADNAINPMLVPTGADDCLLFWDADSLGTASIRSQRLSTTGAGLWPASGPLVFAEGTNGLLAACPDAAGGAYVASSRLDPGSLRSPAIVQRVRDNGLLQFTSFGRRVSSTASNQTQVVLVADNAGGVIASWYDDQRDSIAPNCDLFAQRVTALGIALWSPSAVPVCRAGTQPIGMTAVANGTGGVVLVWNDTRNSISPDLYAQGVDAQGQLGVVAGVDPAPEPPSAVTALARPAPNPLPRGEARIAYTLTSRERVQLRVVDATGRVVRVLEDGEREPGTHTLAWDARANGHRLPPGLYLVQLVTPTRSEIRRLVVL